MWKQCLWRQHAWIRTMESCCIVHIKSQMKQTHCWICQFWNGTLLFYSHNVRQYFESFLWCNFGFLDSTNLAILFDYTLSHILMEWVIKHWQENIIKSTILQCKLRHFESLGKLLNNIFPPLTHGLDQTVPKCCFM